MFCPGELNWIEFISLSTPLRDMRVHTWTIIINNQLKNDINWKLQNIKLIYISSVTQLSNRMLGLIKRRYTFLDKDNLLCPYKAIVRPILEYGVTIWSPYRKGDIDAVESVQRRATRILPELRGLDYEARLRSLQLPTLTYRRLRGDVINVYTYIHGIYRLTFSG